MLFLKQLLSKQTYSQESYFNAKLYHSLILILSKQFPVKLHHQKIPGQKSLSKINSLSLHEILKILANPNANPLSILLLMWSESIMQILFITQYINNIITSK